MAGRLVFDLVAGIASSDPGVRRRSADEVTDIHHGVAADDIHVLTVVLISARLAEPDREAQEAQLHALAELAEWHEVSDTQVRRLAALARPTADPAQDEYLSFLLDGGRA